MTILAAPAFYVLEDMIDWFHARGIVEIRVWRVHGEWRGSGVVR